MTQSRNTKSQEQGVLTESTYPEISESSPEAHSPEPILKEWGRKKLGER
jgi:hypothetical protein